MIDEPQKEFFCKCNVIREFLLIQNKRTRPENHTKNVIQSNKKGFYV